MGSVVSTDEIEYKEYKRRGYSDAYYGKDRTEEILSSKTFSSALRELRADAYQKGRELFSSEQGSDIMYELGS